MPLHLSDWISAKYLQPKTISTLTAQFTQNQPFPFLELRDFLLPTKAQSILAALTQESFTLKESDLFAFLQTADFASTEQPLLQEFRSFFASHHFISYLASLTALPLQHDRVDMSGTLYQDTHYLLPHDDQLDERRLAYVYYLSDLKKSEGGGLCFYNHKNGAPFKIVKNIRPRFNSFVLFEVSPHSFHEVNEVTTDKQRIAISGWFYGQN